MEEYGNHKPHCLLLPYPIQGHINPFLQFAKRLSHRGLHITLALPKSAMIKSSDDPFPAAAAMISVRCISDGFDEGGRQAAGSFEEYCARFKRVGRETLTELLRELENSGRPVGCVVYDPFIVWALDLAKGLGLPAAPLFTQSCAVNSVYHQVYCGRLKLPLRED